MIFKFLTLSIFLSLYANTLALDCSEVVFHEDSGVLNWRGNVTFKVPVSTTDAGWTMALTFDQQFTGVGVWTVWTRNHGDEKWAEFWNREDNARLDAGQIFSFRFRVNYFTNVTAPVPVGLKFFDIELCK